MREGARVLRLFVERHSQRAPNDVRGAPNEKKPQLNTYFVDRRGNNPLDARTEFVSCRAAGSLASNLTI